MMVWCFFFHQSAQAQSIDSLAQKALNDSLQENRLWASERLTEVLFDTLSKNPQAVFTRFNNFSIVASENLSVRIFTWCSPLDQGFFQYFGIIQYITDTQRLFILNDNYVYEESRGLETLNSQQWYGALYSNLITVSYKKETFYTLLGWDGNNGLSDIKVIDVLYFENNEPHFGKEIFENCAHCQRILLQFRQNANCSLRYSKQTAQREGKLISGNMIVFSHLEPENEYFEGMKSMYIPSEIFDAYFWKNGKWLFLNNIDARNY